LNYNFRNVTEKSETEFNSEHRELYSNMGMHIEYTIFLMMRLKSFRPEIDKKLAAPERMPKIKIKKSP
jgi:hypothetical protein